MLGVFLGAVAIVIGFCIWWGSFWNMFVPFCSYQFYDEYKMNWRTVPTFNSCTECAGNPGIIQDYTSDWHPASGAWMTSKLKVASTCKLCGSLVWLAYSFDMLAMGVCTTRQWQTPGWLVQELNACTVQCNPRVHVLFAANLPSYLSLINRDKQTINNSTRLLET